MPPAAQTNGRVIRGQNAISHPGRGAAPQAAAVVDKHAAGPPMEAPIRRIFYLSSEGTHQARHSRGLVSPHEYVTRNHTQKCLLNPLSCMCVVCAGTNVSSHRMQSQAETRHRCMHVTMHFPHTF